tara:strand:- start:471 stop:893 length:423 start_codon:yes stop_codon:yes gene_type:complete
MNIAEAAQQFVDAHKPSRIDVSHIEDFYGSVECFIETDQCAELGDMGEYQLEIRGMHTRSGNPEIITWYAKESYQIAWYDLPHDERKTIADHTCEYMVDPDLDCSIDFAKEQIENGKHDVTVFSLENGMCSEDLQSYLSE